MTILGVDVSSWQPKVDWRQLAIDGYQFAYAKCTDGLVPDKMHDVHVANARAAGIPIGSYHFGHPSQDVKDAAEFFVSRGTVTELRPVLDMEALSNGAVPHNAATWSDDFCEWVKHLTGKEPIIYASKSYFETMCVLKPELGGPTGWDWWIAAYESGVGVMTPNDLKHPPKSRLPYVAWQWAGNVALPGQVGLWDVDVVLDSSIASLRVPEKV